MTSEKSIVTSNSFERHAQTALVLLLVALLLWVGNTTQQTAVTVAKMSVELAYLKEAAEEPILVHSDLARQMSDLQRRVTELESREHSN